MTVHGEVRDLFARDQPDWKDAQGQFEVSTVGELDLTQLGAVLAPRAGVAGRGELRVTASWQNGRLSGNLDARGYKVHTRARSGVQVRPVDLVLAGSVEGDGASTTGTLALRGEPGRLVTRFEYHFTPPTAGRAGRAIRWSELAAAGFAG